MKKYLLVILTFSLTSHAELGPNAVINLSPHYDVVQQKLIPPDQYLMRKAAKSYRDGYYGSALSNFKKAAAFGNSEAQMYVGLMYLKALGVPKDWAKGYAWIKLSALDQTKKRVELKESVFSQLKPSEKNQSQVVYQQIENDYNPSETLKRRDRWVRKQKFHATGTRTGSPTVNVQSQTFDGTVLDNDRTSSINAMQAFVDNYDFGTVKSGAIIPKQE